MVSVKEKTLVILYKRSEERTGGLQYILVTREEYDSSVDAVYLSVIVDGVAVSASVCKA